MITVFSINFFFFLKIKFYIRQYQFQIINRINNISDLKHSQDQAINIPFIFYWIIQAICVKETQIKRKEIKPKKVGYLLEIFGGNTREIEAECILRKKQNAEGCEEENSRYCMRSNSCSSHDAMKQELYASRSRERKGGRDVMNMITRS